MTKALIINADDFGLTNSINLGIIKAFKNGVVKSASLMVTGSAFDNAVKLINTFPDLDIGLHLTLTDEKPALKPHYIKSLANSNGRFFPLSAFLLRYWGRKIKKEEIELELRAQFEKAMVSNLKITHVDSHNHIHVLPAILDITIKLCKEFNIKYIRYPSEKIRLRYLFSIPSKRVLLMCAIRILLINAENKIKKTGLKSTRFFFGFLNSGNLRTRDVKRMISSLKNGLSELMVHPGETGNELLSKYGRWNYDWERELDILTQEDIKTLLEENSVNLLRFKDLY